MIRACIFDLDGTLADTLESMAYVANVILKKFSLKSLPVENFKYYCGEGANMLMRRCLKDAGDEELLHFEEGQRIYREMFAEDPMYKVTHYPGMPETIKGLKERGLKLAVCSNKPHPAAVKVIAQMFGGDFDIVLGQSQEIRRKPAPDAALKIAGELGVRPCECMYVGDTGTDMETGKAAGMYTIGALWGFRDKEELLKNGADGLAEKPQDLLELYEEKKND
ncbi:MAG: HAD family hydrolase [Eubacteriales bacterium]|nr:HAD family hydrolase [Eubacteriales bacterium]